MKMINAKGLYETLAEISRKKAGGDFCWCRSCGKRKKVDHAKAMRSGWPRCCGVQMTIDPPQEA